MEKNEQGLYLKLEKELEKFVELSPLERMRAEVNAVKEVLLSLKQRVLSEGFVDQGSEIAFFKSVKPKFYALLILAVERYGFEKGKPLAQGKSLQGYCKSQLDYIERFFLNHRFLYEYYRLSADELDHVYFVRGVQLPILVGADLPALDASFATVGDYLFAKFIALEGLQELVLAQMQVPAIAGTGVVRSKKGRELRWTGDSCNLIELAYGIFDCKQINGGEVDLSDIMEVFEACFQVNLSRYFRRFTEIKRRKSMSKTRFLDEMARVVNKRIEDGDAYVPMSMR